MILTTVSGTVALALGGKAQGPKVRSLACRKWNMMIPWFPESALALASGNGVCGQPLHYVRGHPTGGRAGRPPAPRKTTPMCFRKLFKALR